MRDDARLAAVLAEVVDGSAPLLSAIRAHEAGMIDYGFAAVRRGAANGEWTLGQDPLPEAVPD